jgi:RNA-directed DNA polymerase
MPPRAGRSAGKPRRLGVREAAKKDKRARFTALLHHVTLDQLRTSFYALKRKAAPGVDGVTWQLYEADLGARLVTLHAAIHRGSYRAQPSRPLDGAIFGQPQHLVIRSNKT